MLLFIHLFLTSVLFLSIFCLGEFIFRRLKIAAEVTRKANHVLCAVIVACLPVYLSYREIFILGILFVVVLFVSKKLRIFGSIHNVARSTHGELWFPAAVTVMAILHPPVLVFACAVLVMGFSDTLANVVGQKWGEHTYKIWGQTKSWEGSVACFLTTQCIVLAMVLIQHPDQSTIHQFGLSIATSAFVMLAEAISPRGSDNFTIPLVVVALMSL